MVRGGERDRVVKAGQYKLSPNEVARLLEEEKRRRRIQRIKEVREQSKAAAARIRDAVRRKENEFMCQLAQQVKDECEAEREEKAAQLQQLYEDSLKAIGQAHNQADDLNKENLSGLKHRIAEEREKTAVARHGEALRHENLQRRLRDLEETKQIRARKQVLDVERERAKKLAALPRPEPDDLDLDPVPRKKCVTYMDASAFSSTHFHMVEKDYAVERADPDEQGDARKSAAEAADRFSRMDESMERRGHGRQEAAQLRGKHALYMERLKHDYQIVLDDLGARQRADVNRRQQAVANIPKQIFQPPHRRAEDRRDRQRDIENAFHDVFFDVAGEDISLTLDTHPTTLTSTDVTDVGDVIDRTLADVTAASRDVGTPASRQAALKDITNDETEKKGLRTLMNKIKAQREQWISQTQQTVPERDTPKPDLPPPPHAGVERPQTPPESLPRGPSPLRGPSPRRGLSPARAPREGAPRAASPPRHPRSPTKAREPVVMTFSPPKPKPRSAEPVHSPPVREKRAAADKRSPQRPYLPGSPERPGVPGAGKSELDSSSRSLEQAAEVRETAARQIISADKQLLQFEADRVRNDLKKVIKEADEPKNINQSHDALREHAMDIEKKIRDLETKRQEILARETLIQARAAALRSRGRLPSEPSREPPASPSPRKWSGGPGLDPEHIRRIKEYQQQVMSRSLQGPPVAPKPKSQAYQNIQPRPQVDQPRSQGTDYQPRPQGTDYQPRPPGTDYQSRPQGYLERMDTSQSRSHESDYYQPRPQELSQRPLDSSAYSSRLEISQPLSQDGGYQPRLHESMDISRDPFSTEPHQDRAGRPPMVEPRLARPRTMEEVLAQHERSKESAKDASFDSTKSIEFSTTSYRPQDSIGGAYAPSTTAHDSVLSKSRASPSPISFLDSRNLSVSPPRSLPDTTKTSFLPQTSPSTGSDSATDSDRSFSVPLDLTTKTRPSIMDKEYVSPRPSLDPRTDTLKTGISTLLERANQQHDSLQKLRQDMGSESKIETGNDWQQKLLEWMKPLSTTPENGTPGTQSSKSSDEMELDERRLAELDSISFDDSSHDEDIDGLKRRPPITKKVIFRDDVTPHELSTIQEMDTPASDQSTLVPSVTSTPTQSPQKAVVIDDTFSAMQVQTPTRPETEGSDGFSPRPGGIIVLGGKSDSDSFKSLRPSDATRSRSESDKTADSVTAPSESEVNGSQPKISVSGPVTKEILSPGATGTLPSPIMKNKPKAVVKETLPQVDRENFTDFRPKSSSSDHYSPLSQYSFSTDTERQSLPQTSPDAQTQQDNVYSRLIAELASRKFGADTQRPGSSSGTFQELQMESDPSRVLGMSRTSTTDASMLDRPPVAGAIASTQQPNLTQYSISDSTTDGSFVPKGKTKTWMEKLEPYRRPSPDLGSSYLDQTSLTWKDKLAQYYSDQSPSPIPSQNLSPGLSQHPLDSDSPSTVVSASERSKESPGVTLVDKSSTYQELTQFTNSSDSKGSGSGKSPEELTQYRMSTSTDKSTLARKESRDPVRVVAGEECPIPGLPPLQTPDLTQIRFSSSGSSGNLTDSEKRGLLRPGEITRSEMGTPQPDITQHPMSSSAISSAEKRVQSPLPPPIVELTQYPISSSSKTSSDEKEETAGSDTRASDQGTMNMRSLTQHVITDSDTTRMQDLTQVPMSDSQSHMQDLTQNLMSDTQTDINASQMRDLTQMPMSDSPISRDLTQIEISDSPNQPELTNLPLAESVEQRPQELTQFRMTDSQKSGVFAPMTVSVDSRPRDLTQLSMADSAGLASPTQMELTETSIPFSEESSRLNPNPELTVSEYRDIPEYVKEQRKLALALSENEMSEGTDAGPIFLSQNPLMSETDSTVATESRGLTQHQLTDSQETRTMALSQNPLSETTSTRTNGLSQYQFSEMMTASESMAPESLTQNPLSETQESTTVTQNPLVSDSSSPHESKMTVLELTRKELTQAPFSESSLTFDSTQSQRDIDRSEPELSQYRMSESRNGESERKHLTQVPIQESSTSAGEMSPNSVAMGTELTQVPLKESQLESDLTQITVPESVPQFSFTDFNTLTLRSETPENGASDAGLTQHQFSEGELTQHRMHQSNANNNNSNNNATSVWYSDDVINVVTVSDVGSDVSTSDAEERVFRLVQESRRVREEQMAASHDGVNFRSLAQEMCSDDVGIMDEPDLTFSSLMSDSDTTPRASMELPHDTPRASMELSTTSYAEQTLAQSEPAVRLDQSEVATRPLDQSASPLESELTQWPQDQSSESLLSFREHEDSLVSTPGGRLSNQSEASVGPSEPVSLAEAFARRKADLIHRSERRVHDIRSKPRPPPVTSQPATVTSQCSDVTEEEEFREVEYDGAAAAAGTVTVKFTDPKELEKEKYKRTERLYGNLEEVKQRKLEQDRKKMYAANREKAKEYQKKLQEKRMKKFEKKK